VTRNDCGFALNLLTIHSRKEYLEFIRWTFYEWFYSFSSFLHQCSFTKQHYHANNFSCSNSFHDALMVFLGKSVVAWRKSMLS